MGLILMNPLRIGLRTFCTPNGLLQTCNNFEVKSAFIISKAIETDCSRGSRATRKSWFDRGSKLLTYSRNPHGSLNLDPSLLERDFNSIRSCCSSTANTHLKPKQLSSSSTASLTSLMDQLNISNIASQVVSPVKDTTLVHQRGMATLLQMHKTGPHKKFRPPRKPLDGAPMLKGVVLRTLIKKPKKPNSANRKCVLVRLSNGKEALAYVPGIGHNLQEHNIVLVRCGRLQDVPGVKLKCIRGKFDLQHVIKQTV